MWCGVLAEGLWKGSAERVRPPYVKACRAVSDGVPE